MIGQGLAFSGISWDCILECLKPRKPIQVFEELHNLKMLDVDDIELFFTGISLS